MKQRGDKFNAKRLQARDADSFYEQYLEQHPEDGVMRTSYARSLASKGRVHEAKAQYERAARDGDPGALVGLKQLALQLASAPTNAAAASTAAAVSAPTTQKKRRIRRVLLLLLLLLLLPLPLRDELPSLPTTSGTATEPAASNKTSKQELPRIVVENAIRRYREANGQVPPDLDSLTGGTPGNWLSYLPAGVSKKCPCAIDGALLELHYYPQTNQLALARGEEVLALYPVASGAPMPFSRTKVSKRVVNPNGGKGGLGTRGLQLQDNYAIHGTYNLDVIGKKGITKGCLRLRNQDIESLYPYVALGTPFEVRPGTPGKATFPGGLPPLGKAPGLSGEETPGVVYTWKE